MLSKREIVLCRYRYDPLDRLASTTPLSTVELQRFYCKSRLATEIQGQVKHSIFQHDDQLLAQQQSGGDMVETTLLVTDQQRSVLHAFNASPPQPIAYSPYGHRPLNSGLLSLLGFNGERRDPVTGHYLLGSGYRAFNPVLMRFNSPDSWSPFGDGGLNPYAYCLGDPVNGRDPTGHSPATILLYKNRRNFLFELFKDMNRQALGKLTRSANGRSTSQKLKKVTENLDIINENRKPTIKLDNHDEVGRFKENHDAFIQAKEKYIFDDGIPSSTQANPNDTTPFTATLNHYRDQNTYYQFYDSNMTLEQISQKIRGTELARDQFLARRSADNPLIPQSTSTRGAQSSNVNTSARRRP